MHAALERPSAWVARWSGEVRKGPVLDLACGGGRHARLFRDLGFDVVALDREPISIEGVSFVQADLEGGNPWPLEGRRFGGIVVTNYLHRPLFAKLAESLDEGGVLIYETFMAGNERFGKPSNPAFLLRPGELKEVYKGMQILAFEEGEVSSPKPAMVQRICVRR
jgi:SAM-dependent methyltransferase